MLFIIFSSLATTGRSVKTFIQAVDVLTIKPIKFMTSSVEYDTKCGRVLLVV